MPDRGGSSPIQEPAVAPPEPSAGNPRLGKLELELPDGRYLLAYRLLEAASAAA